MSAMQRNKGKAGEREAAAAIREHTGWDAQRRVRQHGGDSDVLGVPGWAIEVKRHATATPGEIATWWAQAVDQAGDDLPLLLYRANQQRQWCAVWPLAVLLTGQRAEYWRGVEWTARTSVQAWAAVARELQSNHASTQPPAKETA